MNPRIFVVLVLVFEMISADDVSGVIPVFKKCSEYGKHILEEEEVGTLVLEVSATVETLDEVEYSLLTNDKFKIDPISGQITTNYKFDRDEPMNEHEELIKVCATNRNNQELKGICDIKIVIDDINDNPPIFQQTPYHSTVLINSTINDVIFKVKATDIDQGENTINVYLTNSDVFSIDSDGTLYLAKNIDKKLGDFYSFTVHAFNQNKASNSDRSLVTLTVIDGSENHSTQTTTVESSLLSNDNTDIDYNDDLDEDNEDGNSNNSFQRSEEANDQTTDKMSSLLKVDAEVHEDEIRSTTFKSKQTTIAQVTVKINLLSNNDAEVDKLNEDETLITTLESEQTTIAQKIDVNNTLLNNTDTEVDKDNDGSMNESITSDGNFTYITTMIARFLMQDFNLFAIVALIIIILLIILVCSYCFCRSKLISHDFISTDNSLYFFGSDKRDSFNMVETKAMNNYEPSPKRQRTINYSPEPKEEQMYQECTIGRQEELYDHLTFNNIPTKQSSTPNESFYKKPTSFISNRIIFPDIHPRPSQSSIPFCQSSNEYQTSYRASVPCYANIPINVKK